MKKSEIENQLLFSLGIFVTTCGSEGGSDSSFANTSAEYCMYCQALDREVLGPVLRSGDYERISQFFRVRHDEPETKLTNFDGKIISNRDLVQHHQADVTPTLIFFGPDGQ